MKNKMVEPFWIFLWIHSNLCDFSAQFWNDAAICSRRIGRLIIDWFLSLRAADLRSVTQTYIISKWAVIIYLECLGSLSFNLLEPVNRFAHRLKRSGGCTFLLRFHPELICSFWLFKTYFLVLETLIIEIISNNIRRNSTYLMFKSNLYKISTK